MNMEDKNVEQDFQDYQEYLTGDPESVQLSEDLTAIRNCFQWLKEDDHGLEVEVMYWALKFMKEDPTLSIGDAISLGFTEWDK